VPVNASETSWKHSADRLFTSSNCERLGHKSVKDQTLEHSWRTDVTDVVEAFHYIPRAIMITPQTHFLYKKTTKRSRHFSINAIFQRNGTGKLMNPDKLDKPTIGLREVENDIRVDMNTAWATILVAPSSSE
jgi:hypothetical protein